MRELLTKITFAYNRKTGIERKLEMKFNNLEKIKSGRERERERERNKGGETASEILLLTEGKRWRERERQRKRGESLKQ